MSYQPDHIKLMPLSEFLDPCMDPSGYFLTAKEIEAQKAGFFAQLYKGGNDDARTDDQRDKRIAKLNSQRFDFVHRISYNKAVGYISRRDKIPLYNGSSFNKKQAERACHHVRKIEELSELEKLELQWEKFEAGERSVKGSVLTYQEFKKPCHHVSDLDEIERLEFIQQRLEEQRAAKNKRHVMSKRSKDKIRDKMLAMYRACANRNGYRPGRVCFTLCTLTFINDIEDNKGMDLLNKFLTTLRFRYGRLNYISVTERQEVNIPYKEGRIHFHILFDMKLPIAYINSLWVKQQIEAGIHHEEAEQKLLETTGKTFSDLHTSGQWAYVQKFLNPVDIDKVDTIDGVSCYLTKYVTKNDGQFDCNVWNCSKSVSHLFTSTIIDQNKFNSTGDPRRNNITSKAGYYKGKDGRKEWRPEKTHINETYRGQYCIINTIYNKSRYKYLLQDLDDLNAYLMQLHTRGVKLDPYQYKSKIMMDQNQFRKEYTDALPAYFN